MCSALASLPAVFGEMLLLLCTHEPPVSLRCSDDDKKFKPCLDGDKQAGYVLNYVTIVHLAAQHANVRMAGWDRKCAAIRLVSCCVDCAGPRPACVTQNGCHWGFFYTSLGLRWHRCALGSTCSAVAALRR